MAAAADLRESLRQRARTQVQQETLSPASRAAPDGDSSMDDALADFKKKAAAGRTRRASISIGGGGSIGAGRRRSASLSPVEVSAAQQPTQLDSFAVPLLCRCCALLGLPLCPVCLLTGGGGFCRARSPHGEDL